MPPVTILSPYSGRPVVVREQDLGRAIRDEQGRVFYVVEDPEHGRYGSRTRKGSAKDLAHYRSLQSGALPETDDHAPAAPNAHAQARHDATGVKRRNPVGIAVLILILVLIVAGACVALLRPQWIGLGTDHTPAPDTVNEHSGLFTPAIVRPVASTRTLAYAAPRHDDPPAATALLGDADPRPVIVPTKPATPATDTAKHTTKTTTKAKATAPAAATTWRPEPRVAAAVNDQPPRRLEGFRHTASGLRYKLTHKTDGPRAKAGSFVHVRYAAKTLEGKRLIDDGQQRFVLMTGEAIRAFDEGLAGIRSGEQLQLFIPRGHSQAGHLPGLKRLPDEPILMDIQVVSVRPGVTTVVEQPGKPDQGQAMPGDEVAIHYLARIAGQEDVIDATVLHGKPMRFTLGRSEVIRGLELGLTRMRPGEVRQVTIPPYLGYGDQDVAGGLIPGGSVLSFRVTLVSIRHDADAQAAR